MLRQDPGTLAFKYWVDECKKGLDIREIEDELAKTDQYKSLIGDSERQYTIQNPLFSSNPDIRCGADFGLDVACCGQTGRITQQYTCPSDQPICNNSELCLFIISVMSKLKNSLLTEKFFIFVSYFFKFSSLRSKYKLFFNRSKLIRIFLVSNPSMLEVYFFICGIYLDKYEISAGA